MSRLRRVATTACGVGGPADRRWLQPQRRGHLAVGAGRLISGCAVLTHPPRADTTGTARAMATTRRARGFVMMDTDVGSSHLTSNRVAVLLVVNLTRCQAHA
jgi:hypothetical protein